MTHSKASTRATGANSWCARSVNRLVMILAGASIGCASVLNSVSDGSESRHEKAEARCPGQSVRIGADDSHRDWLCPGDSPPKNCSSTGKGSNEVAAVVCPWDQPRPIQAVQAKPTCKRIKLLDRAAHVVCEQPVFGSDGKKIWIEGPQQTEPTDYYCAALVIGAGGDTPAQACILESWGEGSGETVFTITPPPR